MAHNVYLLERCHPWPRRQSPYWRRVVNRHIGDWRRGQRLPAVVTMPIAGN